MSSHWVSSMSRGSQLIRRTGIMLAAVILLCRLGAVAQERSSEISVQGTGFYSRESTGQGITQRPTDTGGFLVGYRYHFNRWLSAEANYGFDRNTQQYFAPLGISRVPSDIHQATGSLVVNLPHPRARVNPYLLAGGGALVFNPTGNRLLSGANSQARAAFVYGGGADFPVVNHFSLRAEYRGLVYKAPDFGLKSLNTDVVTHTVQPSVGFVFRF